MTDVILKRFEQPDETRFFELGKFEVVTLGDQSYVSLHFYGAAHYAKMNKLAIHLN